MHVVADVAIATQLAAVVWFFVDRLSEVLAGPGTANGDWRGMRVAVLDMLFDTVLDLYQSAASLLTILLGYWTMIVTLALFTVLGVVLSRHGPELVLAVDRVYESSYYDLVRPFSQILNIVRLAYGLIAAAWDVISFMLGAPLWKAARTLLGCNGHRPFWQNFADLATGTGLFVGQLANAMLKLLYGGVPDHIDSAFATPLLAIGNDLLLRLECTCNVDHGILIGPIRAVLNDPQLPLAVGAALDAGLSLVTALIAASAQIGGRDAATHAKVILAKSRLPGAEGPVHGAAVHPPSSLSLKKARRRRGVWGGAPTRCQHTSASHLTALGLRPKPRACGGLFLMKGMKGGARLRRTRGLRPRSIVDR